MTEKNSLARFMVMLPWRVESDLTVRCRRVFSSTLWHSSTPRLAPRSTNVPLILRIIAWPRSGRWLAVPCRPVAPSQRAERKTKAQRFGQATPWGPDGHISARPPPTRALSWTNKGNRNQTLGACCRQTFNHIGGLATCRNADGNVSFPRASSGRAKTSS